MDPPGQTDRWVAFGSTQRSKVIRDVRVTHVLPKDLRVDARGDHQREAFVAALVEVIPAASQTYLTVKGSPPSPNSRLRPRPRSAWGSVQHGMLKRAQMAGIDFSHRLARSPDSVVPS